MTESKTKYNVKPDSDKKLTGKPAPGRPQRCPIGLEDKHKLCSIGTCSKCKYYAKVYLQPITVIK